MGLIETISVHVCSSLRISWDGGFSKSPSNHTSTDTLSSSCTLGSEEAEWFFSGSKYSFMTSGKLWGDEKTRLNPFLTSQWRIPFFGWFTKVEYTSMWDGLLCATAAEPSMHPMSLLFSWLTAELQLPRSCA